MGKTFKKGSTLPKYPVRKRDSETLEDEYVPAKVVADLFPTPVPPLRSPEAAHAQGSTIRRQSDTKTIFSASFRGDGKIFYLDAVENERGQALRIAEVSKGKRTIIMVPLSLKAAFEDGQSKVAPHFTQLAGLNT